MKPHIKDEINRFVSEARGTPALSPIVEGLERKLGTEDAREVFEYAVSYVPRVWDDFAFKTISILARSRASPEDGGRVKQVVDDITAADTVREVKRAINSNIREHAGLSAYARKIKEEVECLEEKADDAKDERGTLSDNQSVLSDEVDDLSSRVDSISSEVDSLEDKCDEIVRLVREIRGL